MVSKQLHYNGNCSEDEIDSMQRGTYTANPPSKKLENTTLLFLTLIKNPWYWKGWMATEKKIQLTFSNNHI